MDRRKYLRAYVRTDKRGKITPGSLTLLNKLPKTPGFKEVTNPGVNSCYCSACDNSFWISYVDPAYDYSGYSFARVENDCSIYAIGAMQFDDLYYDILNQVDGGDASGILNIGTTSEESWAPYYYITDNDNNKIFLSGYGIIFKKDPGGTTLWTKKIVPTTTDLGYTTFSAAAVDSANNIYVSGIFRNIYSISGYVIILKLSPSGSLLDIKMFRGFNVNNNPSSSITEGGLVIDSTGNLYMAVYYDYDSLNKPAKGTILKLDSSLNYITNYRIDFPTQTRYIYEQILWLEIDANDNLLSCYGGYAWSTNYAQVYFKLNTNTETLEWTAALEWNANPTYRFALNDMSVDKATGSLYATNSGYGPPGGESGIKYNLKISTDGVVEWVQRIYSATKPVYDYWGWNNKNSSINLGVWISCGYNNEGFLFKQPLTPIVDGTYGIWDVSTVTSDFTQVADSYPLVEETIVELPITVAVTDVVFTETPLPYAAVTTPIV